MYQEYDKNISNCMGTYKAKDTLKWKEHTAKEIINEANSMGDDFYTVCCPKCGREWVMVEYGPGDSDFICDDEVAGYVDYFSTASEHCAANKNERDALIDLHICKCGIPLKLRIGTYRGGEYGKGYLLTYMVEDIRGLYDIQKEEK